MKMAKKLIALLFTLMVFSNSALAVTTGEALRSLPVQDAGRIKPYDSFAREVLEQVYGKTKYEGREAYEVVLTWVLAPEAWLSRPIFEVRNSKVLQALNLDEKKRWYKGDELFSNEKFPELTQELIAKRETKEKLTPYFQALQRIENQFFIFQSIATGKMLKVVPPKEGETWISVAELEGPFQNAFLELTKKFVSHIGLVASQAGGDEQKKSGEALDIAVGQFVELARANNPDLYADVTKIKTEVSYNLLHPFRIAYVLYLIAGILLLLVWTLNKHQLMKLAWFFCLLGFVVHSYGFGVRVYLAGRPPVSNMYETVIWVAWGSVLFAMILEAIYKFRFILLAGTLVGVFSLVVADSAPAILDPSLQPLEAVLNSSYWLIIHVMTITISYAAFFLAFMLGDIALIYYLKGEAENQDKLKPLVLSIYKSMQIGVAFLAPGIILGGIWADYSWGRFWGWDPKETWALIVLLGYIAILHGRMTTWIKDFGMAVSAVLTFSLVIMAWYGVNYILGAGLHSYGFGAGGVEYVSVFIFGHFLLVLYTWVLRSSRKKDTVKNA